MNITLEQLEPHLHLLDFTLKQQYSSHNDTYYSMCSSEFEKSLPGQKCSTNCPFISNCSNYCNLHSRNSPELVDIVDQLLLTHPELLI